MQCITTYFEVQDGRLSRCCWLALRFKRILVTIRMVDDKQRTTSVLAEASWLESNRHCGLTGALPIAVCLSRRDIGLLPVYLRQPIPKILVPELPHDAQRVGFGIPDRDRGQGHAVEGVGLDHGVVGHVAKQQTLADLQGAAKA